METIDLAHKRRLAEADKSEDGGNSKITPKDALLEAIRKIDNGEIQAESLIVVWQGGKLAGMEAANADRYKMLGMLDESKYLIIKGWYEN